MVSSPAAAQFDQFSTGIFTTTPITFSLGSGVNGTVTFSGSTAGSSGLSAPTTSGSNYVSNFLLIQPGTVATFTFNYPISNVDLQWGPGNTTPRIDTFTFNTTTYSGFVYNQPSTQATQTQSSGAGLNIVSFSFSSNSASPIKLGVLSSSTPAAPAPMGPVGATLLGNLVAFGAVAVHRRRRRTVRPAKA